MITTLALAALLLSQDPAHAQQPQSLPMSKWPKNKPWPSQPGEKHLKNIRQLTFGGQNAEAYWNIKGNKITYQTAQPEYPDEQIFTMDIDGGHKTLISTGLGRCTCSYFSPDGKYVYFSSTHEKNKGPQAPVDMSKGYVWRVNPDFSLYRRDLKTKELKKIIDIGNYVAETTIDPNGKYMTFTVNDGDIDICRANLDGSNFKKLTNTPGYDGGPFVSWDGKLIAYRRSPKFKNQEELEEFKDLLKQGLVRPLEMDLWVMNSDGSNKRQVTKLPGASFAPFILPGNKKIIFSSNYGDPQGRIFELYLINIDGTGLEQVTHSGTFDSFPMVTRDGKHIVWASNRHGSVPHETNIFVADWVN